MSDWPTATYAAVRGEVNPIDFTALETLRLFCPVAYDAVRRLSLIHI